jgi:SAM-dependent methyltransferase
MNPYLSGQQLYGEELSPQEIAQWFTDEKEGYKELTQTYQKAYAYSCHALNWEHFFRHLPQRQFAEILGLGSAYGDEFTPILARCGQITILEPSDGFWNSAFTYVQPDISGRFPFADQTFDLITCFSTLHHIPKVSTTIAEIARVLSPSGGLALISEPIVSMGDWTKPRRGLTRHERGIPLKLFRKMIEAAGLEIVRESLNCFSLTPRFLRHLTNDSVYNSSRIVKLDALLCRMPWFTDYHASGIRKLRATGVAFILQRSKLAIY